MNPLRLIIRQNGKEVGHFESSPCCPPEQLIAVARHLMTLPDSELELQQAKGEHRILDSGPHGLRVLSAQVLYETADLQAWLQQDSQVSA
ncbi:hypothetical protein [Alcaligenes faecalis]|uniref:hypothetical protein n=1 Tax=Alcaligenes faecalis TaxID=511 RepID=UPI0029337885|nr:hypothetical protein [Alcaligenes faecalis]MDV2117968.1 hypothetical protein [Alcaligenes faecalis]